MSSYMLCLGRRNAIMIVCTLQTIVNSRVISLAIFRNYLFWKEDYCVFIFTFDMCIFQAFYKNIKQKVSSISHYQFVFIFISTTNFGFLFYSRISISESESINFFLHKATNQVFMLDVANLNYKRQCYLINLKFCECLQKHN